MYRQLQSDLHVVHSANRVVPAPHPAAITCSIVLQAMASWVWDSFVPRHRGGGGERAPGTHYLRMRLIAMEFHGDRVHMCTYIHLRVAS